MNYWINDFREELLETLKGWDFLLINDSEARLLSGESNMKRAAKRSWRWVRTRWLSSAASMARCCSANDQYFIVPGYLLEEVFDPTGAGDCFAGGFVGALAACGFDLKRSEHRPEGLCPCCDLRLGYGELLLREVRRGPLPYSDAGGDRCALPRVQDVHGLLEPRAAAPASGVPVGSTLVVALLLAPSVFWRDLWHHPRDIRCITAMRKRT